MAELFPLLFIVFVWSLIGSTIRKTIKNTRDRQQPAKKNSSAAPDKKPIVKTGPDVQASPSDSSRHQAASDWGSLGGYSSEGIDPCHDDPYGMPSGSLTVDYPEGIDPCHPAVRTDRPESGGGPESESSGLNLRFGGNDIVQGFVWGEILNRKRA